MLGTILAPNMPVTPFHFSFFKEQFVVGVEDQEGEKSIWCATPTRSILAGEGVKPGRFAS